MSNKNIVFAILVAAVIFGVIVAIYFLFLTPKPQVPEEKIITPKVQEGEEMLPEKVQALFQDSLDEALGDIEALEL